MSLSHLRPNIQATVMSNTSDIRPQAAYWNDGWMDGLMNGGVAFGLLERQGPW